MEDNGMRVAGLRTRKDASAYLLRVHDQRAAPQTLAKWAVTGKGPPYMLSGRQVLYTTQDLDAWARGRMRGPFRSTAEAKQADGGADAARPSTRETGEQNACSNGSRP